SKTNLADLISQWLSNEPFARTLIIPGGGMLVDSLRKIDNQMGLPEAVSHWQAIRLMDVQAAILESCMEGVPLINDPLAFATKKISAQSAILLSYEFLKSVEPQMAGESLGMGWNVTSDSIAARIANILEADELVLFKSRAPPSGETLHGLAGL